MYCGDKQDGQDFRNPVAACTHKVFQAVGNQKTDNGIGKTVPRYVINCGGFLLSGNTTKGRNLVSIVPNATAKIVIILCITVIAPPPESYCLSEQ